MWKIHIKKAMSDKQLNDYNDVVLQGRILNFGPGKTTTLVTICTGRATEETSYPVVVCAGEARKEIEKHQVGDRVYIEGNIQSQSLRYTLPAGAERRISIFAEKVLAPVTSAEEAFGSFVPDNGFVPSKNSFKVSGAVTSKRMHKDTALGLVLRVHKNNRVSFVRITVYSKNSIDLYNNIHTGDYVAAYGYTQAGQKRKPDGTSSHKQYYIAREVIKIEDNSQAV